MTHPEGEGAFGKGEAAIMILMNVFLRPSMMIIGYISAIALSYVSVWMINAGFDHAIGFIQGGDEWGNNAGDAHEANHKAVTTEPIASPEGNINGGYHDWAGIYAYFFSILVYTTMYMTVVQKSFTLIAILPDKVLRWIGGQAETAGSDASQWAEDTKKQVGDAGGETQKGMSQALGPIGEKAGDKMKKLREAIANAIGPGGGVKGSGSTPNAPTGGGA